MAEGEKIVTHLGLDANELLAGLDGVAQAYEEAGGKLLKTVSVIDKVNDANERLSRTVKVLTDNGKLLTFVATTNEEGMTNLNVSIEESERSVKALTKALQELGAIKSADGEREAAAAKLAETQAKLNQKLGETIDLTKFGIAPAVDLTKAMQELAAVKSTDREKELAAAKLAETQARLNQKIGETIDLTRFGVAPAVDLARAYREIAATQTNEKERAAAAAQLAETQARLNQKLGETIDLTQFGLKPAVDLAKAYRELSSIETKDKEREAEAAKLAETQAKLNQRLGETIDLTKFGFGPAVNPAKELQDKTAALVASREEAIAAAKSAESQAVLNQRLNETIDLTKFGLAPAVDINNKLHKDWAEQLYKIESGYERIGKAISYEDSLKAVNELHGRDARDLLTKEFQPSSNLNKEGLLHLQQAIQAAAKSVASGSVSPGEFQKIVQDIKAGTLNLQRMSLAASNVANQVFAIKNAASGATPQTYQLLLSFQSLLRIFQVQLLHIFFGEMSRGLQQGIKDAAQLQIRISEIKTITQGSKVSTDAWISSLRTISDSFGLDILDAAEGAYEAISNQVVDATTALGFMSEAAEFARATVSTLGQSVNLLSSILNAFNINAVETERIAAILFKTIELGRVRAEDMADTIGATAKLADQAGVSLEEFSASIAVSTIQGVRFDAANTLMRNVLLKLLKPTDEMRKLFRQWGVESGEAAIATFTFAGVLQKLAAEFQSGGIGRLSESLQELRAIQGVVTLAGGDFEGKYLKTLDQIGGTAQSAAIALAEYAEAKKLTQDSAGFKYQQQAEQFKNVLTIDYGDRFLRELVFFKESVVDLTASFKGLAEGVVGFIRPLVLAGVGIDYLLTGFGKLVSLGGNGYTTISTLSGALAGLAISISLINLSSMIAGLFGLAGATTAATAAVAKLRIALVALGLSNPYVIAATVALAAIGAVYSAYSANQDRIRTLDADTKNEFLKSIKDVQEAREAAMAADLALTRQTLQEKFQAYNQALVPATQAFNAEISQTVTGVDELIERLDGLPTLANLLSLKTEDADLSAEKVAEFFDKRIKAVAKDIEKSLDLSDKLKLDANNQNFKESLKDLTDSQALDAYAEKYKELIKAAREASQLDKNGLVKDAEAARDNYAEANDLLEEMSNKRFDLFKETKKSIEDSLKLTKKLTETFEEKQFERSIEGKSDRTQGAAYAKRAREAKAEALKLAAAGDYEGARAQFELADNFFDSSIDKYNAINKKKKGGRGSSSGTTKALLAEEEELQKERLALEEKFRKEQQEALEKNKDKGKDIRNTRDDLLKERLNLEEQFRKGLDAQLAKEKEILENAKEYKKQQQELIANQKLLLDQLNNAAGNKANKEKERTGALTDFYGAATQYAATHSTRDTTLFRENDRAVLKALDEIPILVQQAKDIENNKNLSDKDRFSQVEAIRRKIKDNVALGQEYDTRKGINKEERRIGDNSQAFIEQKINDSSDRARAATRGVQEADKEYTSLKEQYKNIEISIKKLVQEQEKQVTTYEAMRGNLEALNVEIEKMNKRIRDFNENEPDKNKKKSELELLPVPAKAAGGLLSGPSPSGPGDNQLIFARTGEFIVNADSTRKFYSQLVAMNNGHMPKGYARGGQVTNNIGDININVPSGTPTQQTREIASQLRRGLRNKTLSLS